MGAVRGGTGEGDIYNLFKDFAGPIATTFAATVAAVVTFYFNRRQTNIAEAQMGIAATQRDIAKDKLKVDLFKERFEIYLATKSLLEKVALLNDSRDVARSTTEIRELYIRLDEAWFFYDADVRRFLNDLHDSVESLLTDLSADVDVDDSAAWSARADRLSRKQAILRQMYADFAETIRERARVRSAYKGTVTESALSNAVLVVSLRRLSDDDPAGHGHILPR